METNALLAKILDTAAEFKADDVKVLEISGLCDFTDYFVIMTGTSSVHIQSLAEELIYRCKHAGHRPDDVEGLTQGEWVLLDFGDIVVHVFNREKRNFYDLEGLWAEAPRVALPADVSPAKA